MSEKTFEDWFEQAWRRWEMEYREDALMYVLLALKALAAERRREAMTPPFEGPIETFRQPRSISHWGMFA